MLEGVFEDFYKKVGFAEDFIGDITTVMECIFNIKLSYLDSIMVKGSKRIERS
jgi:hypothetical protein